MAISVMVRAIIGFGGSTFMDGLFYIGRLLDILCARLASYLNPGGRVRGIVRYLFRAGHAVSILLSFMIEQAGVSLRERVVVEKKVPALSLTSSIPCRGPSAVRRRRLRA